MVTADRDAKGRVRRTNQPIAVIVNVVCYAVAIRCNACPWLSASFPRRLPCICCRPLRCPRCCIPGVGQEAVVAGDPA